MEFDKPLGDLFNNLHMNCRQLVSLKMSPQTLTESKLKQLILRNPLISDLSVRGYYCGVTLGFVDIMVLSFMENILDLNLSFGGLFNIQSLFPLLDSFSRLTNRIHINFSSEDHQYITINYFRRLPAKDMYLHFFDVFDSPFEDLGALSDDSDDPDVGDRKKLMVQHIESLNLVGKPALYCGGSINELWDRHAIFPFAVYENLALLRHTHTHIQDVFFTTIPRIIPSLEIICLDTDYACCYDEGEFDVHGAEPVRYSFRLLPSHNDENEVPRVILLLL
jgi:hypothetical protein